MTDQEIKRLKEKGYVQAILPDGYIDWVIEVDGAPGTYLDYEGGCPYEKHELKFIGEDYLKQELEKLLNIYTKEQIILILKSI